MLHYSKIHTIVEREIANNKRVPFSLLYAKKNGELIEAENVICTSTHHLRTINIKWPNNEIRKIRMISILKINGKKIYN